MVFSMVHAIKYRRAYNPTSFFVRMEGKLECPNRRRGFSYERRRMREVFASGGYGFRAYASKGIVDICYVDGKGIAHLEQLKFSSKGKARISCDELADLIGFARRFIGCPCIVSLVLKNAYQKPEEYKLNIEGIERVRCLAELKKFHGGK